MQRADLARRGGARSRCNNERVGRRRAALLAQLLPRRSRRAPRRRARAARAARHAFGRRRDGLGLVAYLAHDQGIGWFRRIARSRARRARLRRSADRAARGADHDRSGAAVAGSGARRIARARRRRARRAAAPGAGADGAADHGARSPRRRARRARPRANRACGSRAHRRAHGRRLRAGLRSHAPAAPPARSRRARAHDRRQRDRQDRRRARRRRRRAAPHLGDAAGSHPPRAPRRDRPPVRAAVAADPRAGSPGRQGGHALVHRRRDRDRQGARRAHRRAAAPPSAQRGRPRRRAARGARGARQAARRHRHLDRAARRATPSRSSSTTTARASISPACAARWSPPAASTPKRPRRSTSASLFAALFEPGVSTRVAADDVAGRGVGLDAVRDALARLRGTVSVTSTQSRGAAFTVHLPLTTVVQDALLFKVGGQVYAVPAARVDEIVDVTAADVELGDDERLHRGSFSLPLVRLGALLGVPPPPGASERRGALVIKDGDFVFAATCDKVIGPREIVVRSLGPLFAKLPLYAGATISGAGKVQLILDVGAPRRGGAPRRSPAIAPCAPTACRACSSSTIRAPSARRRCSSWRRAATRPTPSPTAGTRGSSCKIARSTRSSPTSRCRASTAGS